MRKHAANYSAPAAGYIANPLISLMRKVPQACFAQSAANCGKVHMTQGCANCCKYLRKHTPYGGERALRKRLPNSGLGTTNPGGIGNAATVTTIPHGPVFKERP